MLAEVGGKTKTARMKNLNWLQTAPRIVLDKTTAVEFGGPKTETKATTATETEHSANRKKIGMDKVIEE